MKTFMRNTLVALGFVATAGIIAAVADVAVTPGTGANIFTFTCFTTKQCPAAVTINSAGTEILTSGNPGQVTGANGTFPATQSGTWNVTNVSGTVSLPTGASTSALQTTGNTSLATIATAVAAATPAGTNTIGNVGPLAYPIGATPITASATGTTGATTATLAGTSGKTTYICGYSIRANATAAVTVTNTVTGVITATLSSVMWVAPNASGLGVDEQIFMPCIPASGTNQAIAVVSGAPGTGGVVSSKGWGYQL